MKMLVGMLKLGGQASCKQLSEVYGENPNLYIGSTVSLGRRVKNYFDKPSCIDERQERVFVYMFQGKLIAHNDNSYYVYRMRPELKAALEKMDLSDINPNYNGESETEDMNNIGIDKNTILYGPQGTGKTYVTSEYAVAIVENKSLDIIQQEEHSEVYKRYLEYKEIGLIEFD